MLWPSLLLAASLPAQWQTIGDVRQATSEGNHVIFRGAHTAVAVTVLAPDLLRVNVRRGDAADLDLSWSIAKTDWAETRFEFAGDEHVRTIRTAELEIRAQMSPFRLAFYDRQGRPISSDDDALGMAWNGSRVRCWKRMPSDEHYFGLGEKIGPLDKRGRAYALWNTDSYMYDVHLTDTLYSSIPYFMALRNGRAYGIFFDNTYRSSFDFGVESPAYYSFGAEGGEINYYFFYGPDPKKVLARYTELTGRMPLPPRWALGYQQTRYGYYPERFVRFVAENFRQRHISCDALVIDIDYMDGYRVFTWDRSRFPDPARMIADLRAMGMRSVLYMDPGVKVDPNYEIYQEGIRGGYFLRKPDGGVFVGKVWPGDCVFPDFTSSRVREWWGALHRGLLSAGAAGFENDMNEPDVFGTDTHTVDDDVLADDNGQHTPFAKSHNVFGMLMSRAAYEGMLKARPEERPFQTTRSTFAGGQRYSAVFTGDNSSTWDSLRISIQVLLSMGISGFAHAGSEIGGFGLSASPELYARWIEAGVFYPYCRTSTDAGTRNQEPWSYGNRVEDISRRAIQLRYRLLPYLYNAFHQASESGLPVMRPLLLEFPDDPEAVNQNYEFLFGGDLLVAPVLKDDESQWEVYLPQGVWYDFWGTRRYRGPGTFTMDAPPGKVPILVRGGAIIPTQQVMEYTDQRPVDPLTFEIYPAGNSQRSYYEDDGITFAYRQGTSLRQDLQVTERNGLLDISISSRRGTYRPPSRALLLRIHGERNAPLRVSMDGQIVGKRDSPDGLEKAAVGWAFDQAEELVLIKVPDRGAALTAEVTRGVY